MIPDEILELIHAQGWDCDPDGATFTCPDDGNLIEPDGECYCGNVSPLLTLGLI